MIPVSQPWLPDREKLNKYIEQIYQSRQLTNNGPLVKQLEHRLTKYLGVKHLILVSNGTLALQIAYKALELTGEVITSPFSFVATTSSLLWQNLTPVFSDIEPHSLNIDPTAIEKKITEKTKAILPVHVFGNPCNVEAITSIANKYNLHVIYDAAHAFDSSYNGQNILNFGSISTLSFHATKLFHSIEGGAIITDSDDVAAKIRLLINFGIQQEGHIRLCGINAKMNEFSAAMGLCVLDDIDLIKSKRLAIFDKYQQQLQGKVRLQRWNLKSAPNGAYAPVILNTESTLTKVKSELAEQGITTRRYFYPSLNQLSFLPDTITCPESEDISRRILCLPIYPELAPHIQDKIISVITKYNARVESNIAGES